MTAAGNIVSPNWPNTYANNADCIWKIVAPLGYRIIVNFLGFDVQNCTTAQGSCSCDFIEFRDGNSSSAQAVGRFCGSDIPRKVYSSGRFLYVRFKSDDDTGKQGFSADVDAMAIEGKLWCGYELAGCSRQQMSIDANNMANTYETFQAPESDQHFPPAASPELLHHTVNNSAFQSPQMEGYYATNSHDLTYTFLELGEWVELGVKGLSWVSAW